MIQVNNNQKPFKQIAEVNINFVRSFDNQPAKKQMFKRLFHSKPFKWIRYIREELENQKENREMVGEDRDGNKYYQYYSYWGLPIRREIWFKDKHNFNMTDLVYYRWLHNQEFDAPTQTEKQRFYLEEKIRYERALQWDTKEKNASLEFKRMREELGLRDKAMAQLQKELEGKEQLTQIKTRRNNTTPQIPQPSPNQKSSL